MAQERTADGAALHIQPTPADAARIVRSLTEGDLKRQRVLVLSDFDLAAYSSAALRWLLAPRTAMTASKGTRRIGMTDIHEIREATGAFRVLDNRLGGGRIRPTVVEYLHTDIAPLLRQGRCTEEVRRHLFSAAAELTQLAGWQAYDLEMQGLAQRYLVQALTMARFAGDEGLGGEILAAMSHQAAYVAQPEHAIDMALAAQLAGRRAGLPVLETESIVMEAHGHALRRDAGSCSRALRRAETVFSHTTTGSDLPAWLSYFDEAYFAAKIAHCFHALGQGVQTENLLRQSPRLPLHRPLRQRGPFLQPGGSLDHHSHFLIGAPPFMHGVERFTFHFSGPTEMMTNGYRFVEKGYQAFWDGNHILGSNWFWYFNSPFACHMEMIADMDLHDASWTPRVVDLKADNSQTFLLEFRKKWMPGPGIRNSDYA